MRGISYTGLWPGWITAGLILNAVAYVDYRQHVFAADRLAPTERGAIHQASIILLLIVTHIPAGVAYLSTSSSPRTLLRFSEDYIYTLCSKKVDHQTHGGNSVKDFQNSFTG